MEVVGNIVDLEKKRIFSGKVFIENGRIISLVEDKNTPPGSPYILPGFIDSHVHIESSLLIPSEFARLAVCHGTVATVSDPHEIGNVLGIDGVRFMIENAKKLPFHFYFGAPSCVPATQFETAGAVISVEEIKTLFEQYQIKYLSEMMNYPGVLNNLPLVMDKIRLAHAFGLPVDGHAPGLKGLQAKQYISAGISTDHECYSLEEALDKLKYGMKILIREGSAAKNYEALHTIIPLYPDRVMFCSDDKHPHELVKGHINELVKRSVNSHGYDPIDVLRCACYNPVLHYNLDVGLLKPGHSADFIVVDNLKDFNVLKTFIKGMLVAENGKTLIPSSSCEVKNNFKASLRSPHEFAVKSEGSQIQVIVALDGELITKKMMAAPKVVNDLIVSDPEEDVLKLVVINRYEALSSIAKAFIKGFKLKKGAIASCVAHDSHNIIAVGTTDKDLCAAVNAIIENKGGISLAYDNVIKVLPLPIAGIMSHEDGYEVAKKYIELEEEVKALGSQLQDPFMTLSFMALLVIPSLKLSDQGLFDGDSFNFTPLSI